MSLSEALGLNLLWDLLNSNAAVNVNLTCPQWPGKKEFYTINPPPSDSLAISKHHSGLSC